MRADHLRRWRLKPMGVIYLVRHAQASFGGGEYDQLSPLGERQARHLGTVLNQRGITPYVAITGCQMRQRETARLALSAAGSRLHAHIDEGYDEYDHQALLERSEFRAGLEALRRADDAERARQFGEILAEAVRRWVDDVDGGYPESFGAFRTRVMAALRRTAESLASGQTALVVTSGGPISVVAALLTEASNAGWLRLSEVMVNTGITKIASGPRGLSLVSLNEHAHLEGVDASLFSYR